MDENKPVDDSEKSRAYRKKKYMTEYMKDRRADDNFKNMWMKIECKATLIANI